MYSALIEDNNDEHILENLEDKYAIFKKVKLGNCYKYDGAIAQPFYISFDIDTLNYHIVPETREIEEYMTNIRKNLNKKELSNDWNFLNRIQHGNTRGDVHPTNGHMWIEIVINQISFILEFQTLCFDGDTLNCYLDKIQFVAYPHLETLNYFSLNGNLHIMYPNKGDGNYCVGNNRVVYNTEFNCESKPSIVADKFIGFVEEILKDGNKIYEYNPRIYGKDSSPKVYTHND